MKKYILPLACLICGIVLLQSCKKEKETKYVNLNETVKSGTMYSLDLSVYGKSSSIATITRQASNYTISQVDRDMSTSRNIYHFYTDTKTNSQEKVVVEVKEKSNGRCSHDDQKTVVTINLTVEQ